MKKKKKKNHHFWQGTETNIDWISDDEVDLLQDTRQLEGALTCAPKQVPITYFPIKAILGE